LQGSLLDITLQTDVIVWGVPPEMVELDTRHPKLEFEATAWERGRSLRAVVPSFYLDMYNSGLATASGLPQLSPAAAIGRDAELMLGTSTIAPSRPAKSRNVPLEIVGMTRDAQLLGVLLPLETVQAMNRWYLGDKYEQ